MKNKKASIKQKRNFFAELNARIKEHKATFCVYVILRILVIICMIFAVLRGDWESLFVCTMSLVLFLIPAFAEKNFGIEIPSALEILILLFIFSAEILGELQCYYIKFAYWDTMLHTINGFMCAAIGFAIIDIINRNERFKFQLSPLYLVIVSFCFSMTVGVMWEFFEFGCDIFLRTDMQKDTVINSISSVLFDETNSNKAVIIDGINDVIVNGKSLGVGGYVDIGLFDTMKDLFVNLIGAVVFNIFGFFYLKTRGKGKSKLLKMFLPTPLKSTQEDYLTENE